jgi:hypothetical protein
MTTLPAGYIDGSTANLQFKRPIEIGDKFAVLYPFLHSSWTEYHSNADGYPEPYADRECWKPGIETVGIYPDDSKEVCDDHGWMLSEIVGIYKPGRFQRRVFWTRHWMDPDGKVFGGKVQVTTEEKFRRRNTRFWLPYELKRDAFPH